LADNRRADASCELGVSGSITASTTASDSLGQSFAAGVPAIDFVFGNFGITGNGEAKLQTDARGLWLGATIPVRLSNALTLSARGEYFFPFSRRITVSVDGASFGQDTSTLDRPPLITGPVTATGTGQGQAELDASVKTRWVVLDAEVAYSGLREGTSFLAGVRYDRLEATIGPEAASGAVVGGFTLAVQGGGSLTVDGAASGGVTIPAAASVIAEMHTVSPYLGIRVSTGGPSGALAFEVKGFPSVFFTQNARYHLKRENGYFGEFKAEYSGSLARNLSASVSVRGDVIHASFTDLADFTNLFTIGGVGLPDGPFSLGQPNVATDVAASIHWNQLAVGGSFVLSF